MAVNLGSDSDTVGAITGSMAGLFHGLDNQGIQWVKQLKESDLLHTIVSSFVLNLLTNKACFNCIKTYNKDR